jgi:uncharacterized protein YecA (UPF0149 family)
MSPAAQAFADRRQAFEAVCPPWHDPRADDEVDFDDEGFVANWQIRNPPRWWPTYWGNQLPANWFRAP